MQFEMHKDLKWTVTEGNTHAVGKSEISHTVTSTYNTLDYMTATDSVIVIKRCTCYMSIDNDRHRVY